MANIKSADKRNRQNQRLREVNRARRSSLRTAMGKLRAAIEAGDAEQARDLLPPTLQIIDTTAQKGVIHDNAAARYKSRLTRAVAALG